MTNEVWPNLQDDDKVFMASLEFEDYTMNWWNQVIVDITKRKRKLIFFEEKWKLALRESLFSSLLQKIDLQQVRKV